MTVIEQLRSDLSASAATSSAPAAAFASMARTLLHGCELSLGSESFRLIEVEFYATVRGHEDPYTHCDPRQSRWGEWYFHRAGGTLRNGTFKGVDLTFGSEFTGCAGILLRGARALDEARTLDGPCVLVDAAIDLGGFRSIAELAAGVEGPIVSRATDSQPAMALTLCASRNGAIVSTPRVGLRLAPATVSGRARFCAARYRFLSEPRLTKKGRPEFVCALRQDGASVEEITRATGSPRSTVQPYTEAFARGLDGAPTTDKGALSRCYELGLATRTARSTEGA